MKGACLEFLANYERELFSFDLDLRANRDDI